MQRGRLSLELQKFETFEKSEKNLPPPTGHLSEETLALIERELERFGH